MTRLRSLLGAATAAVAVAQTSPNPCPPDGGAAAEEVFLKCSASIIDADDVAICSCLKPYVLAVANCPGMFQSQEDKDLIASCPQTLQLGFFCDFVLPPETPYYWEPGCADLESAPDDGLGCMADGVHPECRFCGDVPYTGIKCPPSGVVLPDVQVCRFEADPPIDDYELGLDVYYDLNCTEDLVGCKADGKHIGCRFCDSGGMSLHVPCPVSHVQSQCYFPVKPGAPYYWDKDCHMGKLGCRADGIHDKCRFCRVRPYESISCPPQVNISEGVCWFPDEPKTSYYWDPRCRMGDLGCWADGIHAECRFCGSGPWADISCPHHLI